MREALAAIFPDYPVTVSVFGGAAVVEGRAPTLEAKRSIAGFVAHDDGVERVINQVAVAPGARSSFAGDG